MNFTSSLHNAKRVKTVIGWTLLLLITLSIVSCTSLGQPKKVIALTLVAAPDLNPDINGRPSPVVIMVYQLTNPSNFRKSDFMSLTENERISLGNDLVAINTLTLRPGQTLDVEYPVSKNESAFAIVVGYRLIDTSRWQLVYEYPRKDSGLWARLGGKEVSMHHVLVEKNGVKFDPRQKEH